jgi:hypothetical protein
MSVQLFQLENCGIKMCKILYEHFATEDNLIIFNVWGYAIGNSRITDGQICDVVVTLNTSSKVQQQ